MPTLPSNSNPQSRIDAGAHVLEAAKNIESKAIRAKLAAFAKIQAAYASAHKAVLAAEQKLMAAQHAVGEADGTQDSAVSQLAAKLIGDGAPKGNPLSIFKLPSPSALTDLAAKVEAKKTQQLARLAASWKGASAGTKAAAKKVAAASASVEAAMKKVAPLSRAHAAAIAKREALAIPWSRAMAHLKNAARVADDDSGRGIFTALFEVAQGRARPKPQAAPAPAAPEPAAPPEPPAPAA